MASVEGIADQLKATIDSYPTSGEGGSTELTSSLLDLHRKFARALALLDDESPWTDLMDRANTLVQDIKEKEADQAKSLGDTYRSEKRKAEGERAPDPAHAVLEYNKAHDVSPRPQIHDIQEALTLGCDPTALQGLDKNALALEIGLQKKEKHNRADRLKDLQNCSRVVGISVNVDQLHEYDALAVKKVYAGMRDIWLETVYTVDSEVRIKLLTPKHEGRDIGEVDEQDEFYRWIYGKITAYKKDGAIRGIVLAEKNGDPLRERNGLEAEFHCPRFTEEDVTVLDDPTLPQKKELAKTMIKAFLDANHIQYSLKSME